MALISREGEVLTSVDLPTSPIAKPVFGDFDSDGVTDVILVTQDAILGYRLVGIQSTRSMLIASIVLTVFTIVIFMANIRTVAQPSGSSSSSASSALISRGKKNVLSIRRSTDEYHID